MSTNKKIYNHKAVFYNVSNKRLEQILYFFKDIKGKKILDIGCATGYIGKEIKKKNNIVYGIDISPLAIKKAKKVLDEAYVVDLLEQKFPFKENSFDSIVCSEVVEHLIDNRNLFKQIGRVLKKNGFLIITTPNIVYWGHRLSIFKGKFEYQSEGPFDEGHVHFFTYQTLRRCLASNGFKIVAENHVYPGGKMFNTFKRHFPSLFAYQLVIMCKKDNGLMA